MNVRLTCLACCVLVGAPRPLVVAAPEDAVVKVIADVRFPNPVQPWAKASPVQKSGSGVVIDGKRILTNAHVVMYATDLYVQARPGDDKVRATIVALNPEVDLALLTVADDTFFRKRPPLVRSSKLPRVQQPVVVYGFPMGGSDLSVTKGEVSRIDVRYYANRSVGVMIQVSAAVNPGNSGGPAVVDGKLIGLVCAYVRNAQNIGVVIPDEEIEMFLDGVKTGRFDGKATDATGTAYLGFKNDALRRMLKVPPTVKGVLANPSMRSDPENPLQAFDIITRIGDHDLDNDGNVRLPNGMLVPFEYLIPRLARDQGAPLTVWRKGATVQVTLPVTRADNRVLPNYRGEPLRYFIHGPLVFAPARLEDVARYVKLNPNLPTSGSPLMRRWFDTVRFPGEELVVVSAPLFAHKIATGYANPTGKVVKAVNGVPIRNLRHLVEMLRDCTDPFVTLQFADEWCTVLVFDRHEMERATAEILEDNGIAATRRGSADMLSVWRAKTRLGS